MGAGCKRREISGYGNGKPNPSWYHNFFDNQVWCPTAISRQLKPGQSILTMSSEIRRRLKLLKSSDIKNIRPHEGFIIGHKNWLRRKNQ